MIFNANPFRDTNPPINKTGVRVGDSVDLYSWDPPGWISGCMLVSCEGSSVTVRLENGVDLDRINPDDVRPTASHV